jgi:CHAT domain-containing protein
LPGSALEVQAIAALFDQPEVLVGAAAREEALNELRAGGKLKEFRVIHFATHGQGTTARPLESALILAQDRAAGPTPRDSAPPVDGRLTVREVLDSWQLDADLVVLSACESAVGRVGGGDGMIGFSQAFQLAGSRSVVLSLWPVSDTATSLLMVRFYENWLGSREGKALSKAEALKEAKHWLRNLSRKEVEQRIANLPEAARGLKLEPGPQPQAVGEQPFAHPYYWSAFILIGDPN